MEPPNARHARQPEAGVGRRLRLRVASGAWGRLRGLLGRRRPLGLRSGLLLHPCRAVHSGAMAYPIAVWFIGPDGDVLRAGRLPPWRWMSCPQAVAVVETHEDLLAGGRHARASIETQARRLLGLRQPNRGGAGG